MKYSKCFYLQSIEFFCFYYNNFYFKFVPCNKCLVLLFAGNYQMLHILLNYQKIAPGAVHALKVYVYDYLFFVLIWHVIALYTNIQYNESQAAIFKL